MSRTIGWVLPNEIIEMAIKSQTQIEGSVSVWGCQYDEVGEQVILVLEIDEDDCESLLIEDLELYELEEGEYAQ